MSIKSLLVKNQSVVLLTEVCPILKESHMSQMYWNCEQPDLLQYMAHETLTVHSMSQVESTKTNIQIKTNYKLRTQQDQL